MKYSDREWFRRVNELELVNVLDRLTKRRSSRAHISRWYLLLGSVIRTHRWLWVRGIRL